MPALEENWLLEETAAYIGVGKTVFYGMAREGTILTRKVGKKWIFERLGWTLGCVGIGPCNPSSPIWNSRLRQRELRDPQRDGYLRTSEFFRAGKNKAILQIPVGCGKTGLASLLPLGLAEGRVLVIAPNLTIKDGLYEAMDITNRQKCFWRKAAVLSDGRDDLRTSGLHARYRKHHRRDEDPTSSSPTSTSSPRTSTSG